MAGRGEQNACDSFVRNTCASFSAPANVCAWDESEKTYSRNLCHYYNSTGDNVTSGAGLLSGGNGQCHAWAELLKECFLVNDITNVKRTRVTPPAGYNAFGVKNIDFDDEDPYYPEDDPWKYRITDEDEYGREIDDLDITATGIPGQNMGTPYAKLSGQHFIVHRTGNATYYGPSYGITTTGGDDYTTDGIEAWMDWIEGAWHWRKESSAPAVDVVFSDEDW